MAIRRISEYNPDVLSCLADLSNDEVFTPPEVVNQVLDMLPQELFSDPNTRFLDPFCKTGVFLREIARRLVTGLEPCYPDIQERLDHIFHEQLYGIAITEMTSLLTRRSLYCSKNANSVYSVSRFDTPEGNIHYEKLEHSWVNGQCEYCGASQDEYDRNGSLESHAYGFIHPMEDKEFENMRFDVIIGNPPYQLSDTDASNSARPIYQLFVGKAKQLKPRYLSMIIPSRWFAGGKGLDKFRQDMLTDKHMRKLVDYGNSKDVFPGVVLAGGACYFLWERDYQGPCEVVNYSQDNPVSMTRYLDEHEVFIRQNDAVSIVNKIQSKSKTFLNTRVTARKPFGLATNYQPRDTGVPCWFKKSIGLKHAAQADVTDKNGYLDKWKVLITPLPLSGNTDYTQPVGIYRDDTTIIAKPGECCTESWIVAGAFDTEAEALSYKSYLLTKTVQFLLLQSVVSQHVSKKSFRFVPDLGKYTGVYTDERLRRKWGITAKEWEYIDSRVK